MNTHFVAVEHITHPQEFVRSGGRIHALRRHGRMTFADLWSNGFRIQICYRGRDCPWHIGMWIEIQGRVQETNTGELTIWCEHFEIFARPTRPMEQDVDEGQSPPEHQYILEPAAVQHAYRRSNIIRSIREFFWSRQFHEVATPILAPHSCGAAARPFETHIRATGQDSYLRLAPEAHLMRLMMAGFDRIFEIGPCFRNEGISSRHQPQFELMECYRVGDRLEDTMTLVDELMMHLFGGQQIVYRGMDIDFSIIERISLEHIVERHTQCSNIEECINYCIQHHIFQHHDDPHRYWVDVFEHGVEQHLINPTIVFRWPCSISPLAYSDDQIWSQRFEMFIGGMEIANGYEQERDGDRQRERFEQQALIHNQDEAMDGDEHYLFAMGWGMPALSGFGMGIDRVVQLLTNCPDIRQTILFPIQ